MNLAATVYVLFIVTYGADVKTSHHTSLAECEEARSVATTGLTIEAKRAKDEADKKAAAERQAKFDREHPWREPQTESEKENARLESSSTACGRTCTVTETKGGKIRKYETGFSIWFGGGPAYSNAAEIKTSVCAIVPETSAVSK